MAIYRVELEAKLHTGPLLLTEKRTFHMEGGQDDIDDMFRLAASNDWSCTLIPIATRLPASIAVAFGKQLEAAKRET